MSIGINHCKFQPSLKAQFEKQLVYKRGQNWVEVDAETPYPLMEDELNRVVFSPVTTPAMKLEVKLQEEYSAGLHEWTVK